MLNGINEYIDLHLGNFYLKHKDSENIALTFQGNKVTYKELVENIDKYAQYFLNIGLKQGDTISLSSENSPEFIYTYLASAKIGATVVPLNLALTVEELKYIIKDSQSNTLLISNNVLKKMGLDSDVLKSALNLKEVLIINKELTEKVKEIEVVSELPTIDPKSLSSLLYTSGTTGHPKGAMLSHTNLVSNVVSISKLIDLNKDDNLIAVLPMFHSFGFTVNVLFPLFTGATIVIHSTFSPKELVNSLIEDKITVFAGVPAMFIVLIQALKSGKASFPHLRLALAGGAALPVEITNVFRNEFNISILEGYGLTEASPVVSFTPIDKPLIGSIGKEIPFVETKIVDEDGKEVTNNIVGELVVKGPNVMLGYFNNEKSTKETIIDGWLHTGDMAYKDKDGYIYIVDRKKDLIIVSGLNVYPREVEEVLYQHPNILEVAVIGVPNKTKGESVKAVISLKDKTQTLTKHDVFQFLKDKLANYKIPREVEIVDALPKNATGKILKKNLREAS